MNIVKQWHNSTKAATAWLCGRLETVKSGAEATAVQTLRDERALLNRAKRLDCMRFTAAFLRQRTTPWIVAASNVRLPPRSRFCIKAPPLFPKIAVAKIICY
ncbi:MAG: hypothetical protein WDM80_03580 [Limisphaerales bacterium]